METLTTTQLKRYNKKSIAQLIKLAVKNFNSFIRQRDSEDGYFQCISCREYKPVSQMNASHYMPGGLHSATRFDPLNVHGGCIKCNKFMSGNLVAYRKALIEKIGTEAVEKLEIMAHRSHKWNRESLIWIIENYKANKYEKTH